MSKKTKIIGRKSKIHTNHNNIIVEPVNKGWKEITDSWEKEFIKKYFVLQAQK